jgi:hypothetical protein
MIRVAVDFLGALVVQVLSLREAEVAQHHEGLAREVRGQFLGADLRGQLSQLVKDIGRLLEVLAGQLDSVAIEGHVAGLSHLRDAKVVKARYHFEVRVAGDDSLPRDGAVPRKLNVKVVLLRAKSGVLAEADEADVVPTVRGRLTASRGLSGCQERGSWTSGFPRRPNSCGFPRSRRAAGRSAPSVGLSMRRLTYDSFR